jgi:hypothetical protein
MQWSGAKRGAAVSNLATSGALPRRCVKPCCLQGSVESHENRTLPATTDEAFVPFPAQLGLVDTQASCNFRLTDLP